MRIDLYGPQSSPEAEQRPAASSASNASSSSLEVASTEDQAQFSGAHVQVAALAAQANQLPEIRQEKVEPLRQSVTSGRYALDPEKIAGAMVSHLVSGSAA